MKKKFMLFYFLLQCFTTFGQDAYVPSAGNLANRVRFQDDKFGLFIHWGLYSQLADGEWVMQNKRIPYKTYEKLAETFYPAQFNAEAWVLMAKNAGMKYITITTKHHDGFCMWDSKATNYDIMDATAFKRDIIKELSEACKKHGMILCFYYSLLDWHHPDYPTTGKHGQLGFMGGRKEGDFSKYVDYMCAQLTELLTNYGPIGTIWFDGEWENLNAKWNFEKIYKTIHSVQPNCMIGNNHHQNVRPGEDFQMFEKDLPGKNSHGWVDKAAEIAPLPLEMCETMNDAWGFNLMDKKYKTTKKLVKLLVENAGSNANFLLNVGPMPNGKIQPECIDTLKKIGAWTEKYGESIYGTRGGLISNQHWGTVTSKNGKYFFHILNTSDPNLLVQGLAFKPKKLIDFESGKAVPFKNIPEGILIQIKGLDLSGIDKILVAE